MNERSLVPLVRKYALYLAWLVSLVATGGSLFLSEIMHYTPCKLCWIQRIFMYPLAILLGMACYRNDRQIIRYALPLSIIGGLYSVYHYAQQKIPGMAQLLPCTEGVPCNVDYLNWFGGVVTIPFLALIAFVLITVILLFGRLRPEQEIDSDEN